MCAVSPQQVLVARLGIERLELSSPEIAVVEHTDGYVGSETRRTCHPGEHASWHASWHRTMTQLATPETVIGEFGGTIEWDGKSYDLWREDDEFRVELELPAGARDELAGRVSAEPSQTGTLDV